jgi:hypothetical protein
MFLDAALNVGAAAIAAAYPYLSIHTSGAVTSSANESTAARVAAAWPAPTTGDLVIVAAKNFTGGAANGAAIRVGYWSLATGGTYGGGALLTGDQTFNAAGEYTITGVTENATST